MELRKLRGLNPAFRSSRFCCPSITIGLFRRLVKLLSNVVLGKPLSLGSAVVPTPHGSFVSDLDSAQHISRDNCSLAGKY
jgi:hypothetical protein